MVDGTNESGLINSSSEDDESEIYKLPGLNRKIMAIPSEPTIKNLCERIAKGRLNAQSEFQRKYVWNTKKAMKSALIESVLLKVPIPTIYTAEEDDGSEVVIDGQQRLTTFDKFLKNEFKLSGLKILHELNGRNYKGLLSIKDSLQDEIDSYPIRVIKILKESHKDVKFDIFERLNRGSVKLVDQELRNCIFRGSYNTFLKKICKNEDFQVLLGSKNYDRMQDVELALRFFTFQTFPFNTYKSPMKQFLNSFIKEVQDSNTESIERCEQLFNKTVKKIRILFGDSAFFTHTILENKHLSLSKPTFNKGLIDVLMYGVTKYSEEQLLLHKDSLQEELTYLQTKNPEFIDSISGTGTDNKSKIFSKFQIWLRSMEEIISTRTDRRGIYTLELKTKLFENNAYCKICGEKILFIDDSEIEGIKFYWKHENVIPPSTRLVHRYCSIKQKQIEPINNARITPINYAKGLDELEINIRNKINIVLKRKQTNYWEDLIPESVKEIVKGRISARILKHPYEQGENYKTNLNEKFEFCNIMDYFKIIKHNWNLFEVFFRSRTELEKHFRNLSEFRNSVKHSRFLNEIEKKQGESSYEWIDKIINLI